MNVKTASLIFFSFILTSCKPSIEIYSKTLEKINIGAHYYIYDRLIHVDTDNTVHRGKLDAKGMSCLNTFQKEYFPGSTKKDYTLVINGSDNMKYYFELRTINKKIKTISPWKEKLKYGFKGSSLLLKINCNLDELGKM